jgi:hypothetical protein
MNQLPEKYIPDFSPYETVMRDALSGEPVGWGHKPLKRFADDEFSELGKVGEWFCLQGSYANLWCLVTRKLTLTEAIDKYGPVTEVHTGPNGGFKDVTFGTKKFCSEWLDPRQTMNVADNLIRADKRAPRMPDRKLSRFY